MSITLKLPALSPTMTEGTVSKWLVKEGDNVSPGDILAEIETDKATMEMEAVDSGTIGKILVAAGTSAPVHTPIAVLLEEGESEANVSAEETPAEAKTEKTEKTKKAEEKKPEQKKESKKAAPKTSAAPPPTPVPPSSGRVFATPLARRLAREKGVALNQIQGSGPHGRIIKRDVETATPAIASSASLPAVDPRSFYSPDSFEEVPLDNMRRAIAKRLTQSMQQAPHYYLTVDCRIDLLTQARKRLNERSEKNKSGARLSINDFLLRATALSLIEFPDVNSSWADAVLLRHRHADISIAVALEGGGLITPIVRAVESKGLSQISAESRDLITRARERKLEPEEYEGGTFTISNLGMFGIREFTAVINPPQSAILAVGAGRKVPVVSEGGKTSFAEVMTLTLSCDHRVIDGALGARFLGALRERIEDPFTLLL
ncbi:MAG: pyruvate dehydrogenase complex dihydrolipoamide acetyltransferase [Hyphomicrobiales bacterium]|nr:pyruvate dehydrogenase complex dihydrolipoamide acetyltransferase [Hyphomicrobiales bacterium]